MESVYCVIVSVRFCAINIAVGKQETMSAHETLLNSLGPLHRRRLLAAHETRKWPSNNPKRRFRFSIFFFRPESFVCGFVEPGNRS
jgi:hypothetical protein